MKLRLFAAVLLAPLALAGCDRNPIGAGGSALVGDWSTEPVHLPGTAPNGSTNIFYREDRSFRSDGTFFHANVIIDAATARSWVVYARKGSWTATNDVLREVTREAFYLVDPLHIPDVPVLVPVDPQVSQASYELQDATLLITPSCPPGAMCIRALPLHRVATLF